MGAAVGKSRQESIPLLAGVLKGEKETCSKGCIESRNRSSVSLAPLAGWPLLPFFFAAPGDAGGAVVLRTSK